MPGSDPSLGHLPRLKDEHFVGVVVRRNEGDERRADLLDQLPLAVVLQQAGHVFVAGVVQTARPGFEGLPMGSQLVINLSNRPKSTLIRVATGHYVRDSCSREHDFKFHHWILDPNCR